MKYYIIAGEASGDMHGSNLMRGLKEADPECEFRFWGGDLMAEVGGTMVRHFKDTAVLGFVEVLKKLDKISGNMKTCRRDVLSYRPDVLILIDYPGFNLKMAKFAKRHGMKVFYYISPKVWAWKESRVRQMKKYLDMLYIIFPFEVPFFEKKGLPARYFGNPLFDRMNADPNAAQTRGEFLEKYNLPDRTAIALLPGSRKMEIDFLLPRMKGMADILEREYPGKYQFLVAAAPSIEDEKYGTHPNITLIKGDTYSVLRHSDAAVISSGTASLEAAMLDTPQLVCYGGSAISIWIARHVIRITTISLAVMILGRKIFNEWIQDECTPQALAEEMVRLTADTSAREAMKRDYAEMRSLMGGPGASFRVGKDMYELLCQYNNSK